MVKTNGDPSVLANVDTFSKLNQFAHESIMRPPGIGLSMLWYGMIPQKNWNEPSSAAAARFWNANTIGNEEVKLYVSFARGNRISISKVGRFEVVADVCADDVGDKDATAVVVVWAKAKPQAARAVTAYQGCCTIVGYTAYQI